MALRFFLQRTANAEAVWGTQMPSLQGGRSCQRCLSIELFLTQRREEQVVSGDPLRLYRLDRMRRIDDYGGEKHSESRFRNRTHAKANKRPEVRIRDHANLWTVKDEIHRRVNVMQDPKTGGIIKQSG
jgi:hypothetical protein